MANDKLKIVDGGNNGDGPPPTQVVLPPILDVCSPLGSKVCPFMAPSMTVMPNLATVKQRTGLALHGSSQSDGPQPVFVRNFSPCVKGLCMAWVERTGSPEGMPDPDGFCRLIVK